MFVCVKEESPRDGSFMHTKYLFGREKTLIIIIFESIYFLYFSPYNSKARYCKINSLVPMTSTFLRFGCILKMSKIFQDW